MHDSNFLFILLPHVILFRMREDQSFIASEKVSLKKGAAYNASNKSSHM
jgi:hypothetical protein